MLFKKIKIPSVLKEFGEIFEKNGYSAYLVGGAVRDFIMKKKPSDYDVATNATPQDVMKLFKIVIPTGIEHGTVTVHYKNKEIEVTTFRTESGYSDGRHPDSINYAATIEEDLSRRDFTMNAIAISLKDEKLIDPFKGQNDINKKNIRTVGNPHERFMEDGLRPIRAIRFSSQLGFSIEKCTYSEIFKEEILNKIKSVSVERFRDELIKLLKSQKPSTGLFQMEETGILSIFIPELLEGRNCIQNDDRNYHIFDVFDHNCYACDGAPCDNLIVRLAALFHDVGKPKSKTIRYKNDLKIINFLNHEKYSEQITRNIMTNLKFSKNETNRVCNLIENHMFHYEPTWTDAAIRRFLVKINQIDIDELIDLRLADMYGKYNKPVRKHDSESCRLLIELKERIESVQKSNDAITLKDLAINGNDLIQLGIPAGKKIGLILNDLLNCVLEDPQLNQKEKLIEIAKKIGIK